jgi:hypothetical protein
LNPDQNAGFATCLIWARASNVQQHKKKEFGVSQYQKKTKKIVDV